MANEEHVDRLLQGVEAWNRWRDENPEIIPDLSEVDFTEIHPDDVDFQKINLNGVILSKANFSYLDLHHTDLTGTDLRQAALGQANLSYAGLEEANLAEASLIGTKLTRANLTKANLSRAFFSEIGLYSKDLIEFSFTPEDIEGLERGRAILSEACLEEADLSGADLCGINLNGCNLNRASLEGANLTEVQAIGTDFTGAKFTGACIQNWQISSDTNLDGVICEYIFLKSRPLYDADFQEEQGELFYDRRPYDPNQIFTPGEFTKRYQIVLETVDLFFNDGIDWKAFLASLEELQTQYGNEINVQGIEKKSGGILVRLEVPPEVDKAAIESRAKELYERDRLLLETQYRMELNAKDRDIEKYRQENVNLWEVLKLKASQPITVEVKAVAKSQSNSDTFNNDLRGANVANFANKVQDNASQQTNQHIYASPEKQSLADAAQEIQKLLKILEQTNPTASEAEQKSFVTAAIPPTVRQRAVAALQSGGKAAIEEFLDNPYVNVAIAIIEGWRDAGAS